MLVNLGGKTIGHVYIIKPTIVYAISAQSARIQERHTRYLYCTVLYCTILYCTVLTVMVLYCTGRVLYCTVLYSTVL